jgi:hypothetical protein
VLVVVLVLDLLGLLPPKEGMILLQLFCSVSMTAGYQEFSSTSCQLADALNWAAGLAILEPNPAESDRLASNLIE